MADPSVRWANHRRARLGRHDLNSQEMVGDGAVNLVDGSEEDEFNESEDVYVGDPEVGMVFKTHQEVSKFYKRYAQRVGFGVSVRRSSFTKEGQCLYLELMCCKGGRRRPEPKFRKRNSATTDCPAKIRVKLWGDGMLHLEMASLDHNHPVSPSMARFLSCYRQLSGATKKRAEHIVCDADAQLQEQNAVPINRLGGLEEFLFSESEHRCFVERGRLKLQEGDAEALRLFFTRMQAKNVNFFNIVDLDQEGCVRNVFWADSRSRAAYQYYNDVVMLDTTPVTSKYDLPLAIFVGVNHHGQHVLLGCSLLSDETTETYVWLFKAWIACMCGVLPKALITYQCKEIQSAVSEVLPSVRHRLCLCQIMKKVPEKFGGSAEYRAIYKAMQKAIYDSLRADEFEEDWRRIVEIYGLQNNEWFRALYECRHSWAPVYLKDTFWAGMATAPRNETVVPFFEGLVEAKTSLKHFIGKYELALQSKYEKEAQADFETFHKRRPSVSKFFMEEQLSKVYTINIFKKFQDEIEALLYCHASLVKVDGPISTFNVKECIFLDDGKRTAYKNHEVMFNTEEKAIECICGSFQFRGILCRHALSVLKLQLVHEIPSRYVLDRWKKDFKRLHAMSQSPDDLVANNRVDRYDYLSMRCLQLVEVGILSDKYQLALKLIKEAEKFLLSDNTHDDMQPKIKPRVPKANRLLNKPIVKSSGKVVSSENGNIHGQLPQPNDHQDASNTTNVPPVTNFGLQMDGQQYISNQSAIRPGIVYMFPTFGTGQMMPWIYQQTFQEPQNGKLNPTPDGRLTRKRKASHGHKPVEANQEPKAQSGSTAG